MIEFYFLLALTIKHAFADFFLQSMRPFANKRQLLGRGLLHYMDHALCTAFVAVFFLSTWTAVVAAAVFDFVAHGAIDYSKNHLCSRLKITQADRLYWRIQAGDQMLHYITGAVIVYYASVFQLLG